MNLVIQQLKIVWTKADHGPDACYLRVPTWQPVSVEECKTDRVEHWIASPKNDFVLERTASEPIIKTDDVVYEDVAPSGSDV